MPNAVQLKALPCLIDEALRDYSDPALTFSSHNIHSEMPCLNATSVCEENGGNNQDPEE